MLPLTIGQTVVLAIVAIWAIFAIFYVNCVFPKQLRFLDKPEVQNNEKYAAFARNDKPHWNMLEMTFGGIFLLPIRFVLVVFLILCGWAAVKLNQLLFCTWNFDKPISRVFRFFVNLEIGVLTWLIFKTMGFWCVQRKSIRYRGQNPKLVSKAGAPVAIIVSNHTSWVDIFYFLGHHKPSFLSKSGVKDIPGIGAIAMAIQSLFIDRHSHDSRAEMFTKLEERNKLVEQGQKFNRLVIFPEGTTTNNKGLIDFKRGAFNNLKPIKLFALKYTSNFSPQLNMISTLHSFIGVCMQFRNKLTVYEFEDPIGPAPDTTPDEYAENVKMLMCDELGFANFHSTFGDKIDFEKEYMGCKDESYK